MTHHPIPVILEPIYKTKPWGGRRLATVLNKNLPGNQPIGEAWEVAQLPQNESRVRGGPLVGRTLGELLDMWNHDLLGHAPRADGRFPLLVKFLDACEHLSVQVHPKPSGDKWQPGIKHEAWYIVHAEPNSKLYVGLNPDVGPDQVQQAANTPEMVNVLRTWDGRVGECYYLPSGTLHALGAGLLVAEVQTPSDITYRTYDWNRVGLDGKPRELHIDQSLANIRYDVTEDMILQRPRDIAGLFTRAARMTTCDAFYMDKVEVTAGFSAPIQRPELAILMILEGRGLLAAGSETCAYGKGDVLLIPAACHDVRLQAESAATWLEVTIPQ